MFGNGLGMAVNHHSFSLQTALETVWREGRSLTREHRNLVSICLGRLDSDSPPTGEDDLDTLQQVLSCCEYLSSIPAGPETHWLSERGRNFPPAIKRFIHEVAAFFHAEQGNIEPGFIDSLSAYIIRTKSHIATLNYDNLLYQPLIERRVLSGYRGSLIDGFTDSGFSSANLERLHPNRLGWYLHLHGSPLFYNNEHGVPMKLRQQALGLRGPQISDHIVLTHVRHKPSIISASVVLSTYWEYFEKALAESREIVLFGYSGLDKHLNDCISRYASGRSIRVVEWAGSGDPQARQNFWRLQLSSEIILEQRANILSYREWE